MNQSIFEKIPLLKLDQFTFKAITEKDLEPLEELCAYRTWNYVPAKELFLKIERQYQEKTGVNWGIYLDDLLIGTIGYYRGFENDCGEIGYVIHENFRRKGYTSKIAAFFTQFGLNEMQLDTVFAYTDGNNFASQNLLKKIGFKQVENEKNELLKFQYYDDV